MDLFFITLEQMVIMFSFVVVGWGLGKSRLLPDGAAKTLSVLQTNIFFPAMTFLSLAENLTIDQVADKSVILLIGIATMFACIGAAVVLARLFSKEKAIRNMYIYFYSFSNFAYLGYPLIKAVFGNDALLDLVVFSIPFNIGISTFGYGLFQTQNFTPLWKKLLTPLNFSVVLGVIVGLSGIRLPNILSNIFNMASDCVGINAMILTGIVISEAAIINMFNNKKSYLVSFFRLFGIALVFIPIACLLGIRGNALICIAVFAAMPGGLNTIVFSVDNDIKSEEPARIITITSLVSIISVPVVFALMSYLHLI